MTEASDPLVTLEIILERGRLQRGDGKTWCRAAIREWCARHGVDYLELVHHGIPASVMAATDGVGAQVAQDAIDKARAERGQQ